MQCSNEVFLKIDQNCIVETNTVTIGDFATVYAESLKVKENVEKLEFASLSGPGAHVFDILDVYECIQEKYKDLTLHNEGEKDFILVFEPQNPAVESVKKRIEAIKVVIVCLLIFLGSMFSIMAFHNDIQITGVFARIYWQVFAAKKPPISIIEIFYTIGLAVGILVFFNHVGKKKITHDPTPIQVMMRKYEQDVDDTFIENASRRKEKK